MKSSGIYSPSCCSNEETRVVRYISLRPSTWNLIHLIHYCYDTFKIAVRQTWSLNRNVIVLLLDKNSTNKPLSCLIVTTRCQCFLKTNGSAVSIEHPGWISLATESVCEGFDMGQSAFISTRGSEFGTTPEPFQVNPASVSAFSKHPRLAAAAGFWGHLAPNAVDASYGWSKSIFRIQFGSFISFIALWHALSCPMWKSVFLHRGELVYLLPLPGCLWGESLSFFLAVLDGFMFRMSTETNHDNLSGIHLVD